jgi:hypothetical protein
MRVATIPPLPDALRAPGYTPAALAAHAWFLTDAATAWQRAGDARTAELLTRDADVQRRRHGTPN